jgi:hypothetical protein
MVEMKKGRRMTSAVIAWDVGIKNLSYCVYARDHTILAWDDLDTSIRRGTSLSVTVKKLTEFLDGFCASEQFTSIRPRISHCVIENQPKRNPTMRVVSGILGTYFMVKYGWPPLYFNPAHKLAGVDIGQAFEFGEKSRKRRWGSKEAANAYRMRKRASIEETRRLLQTDVRFRDWLQFFERHRKKDDLGDTLLMARAFLHAPNIEVQDDSDSESDAEVCSDTEADAGVASAARTCALAEFMRQHPRPSKSKSAPTDSVPHFKYCLEDRLHKEYGSNESFTDVVEKVVKRSKSKGIVCFREFLASKPCECSRCDWVGWLLYEPHWTTMFSRA